MPERPGLTQFLAITCDLKGQFKFSADDECFRGDHLFRTVLENSFLFDLNYSKELRLAFMQLTSNITVPQRFFRLPFRLSVPEIFQTIFNRQRSSDAYDSNWGKPLRQIFHFMCNDSINEGEHFSLFEKKLEGILTGSHHPMTINHLETAAFITAIAENNTPENLLIKLDQGRVDSRTMVLVNAAMRAYGYAFSRTVDTDAPILAF